MDAVLWLEDYLSNWDKILFFVCHSQDFMNNVCTHIVRLDMTYRKLHYYTGKHLEPVGVKSNVTNTVLVQGITMYA